MIFDGATHGNQSRFPARLGRMRSRQSIDCNDCLPRCLNLLGKATVCAAQTVALPSKLRHLGKQSLQSMLWRDRIRPSRAGNRLWFPCVAPSKIIYHGDTEDTEFLVSVESSP